MPATVICNSCHRTWNVGASDSVYLQLELLSRPCPYCEAYTLSYRDAAATRVAARFPPTWKRRRLAAPRPGG